MRNVAIACQGGGSHAAFAAGVLKALLGSKLRSEFDLVALSGTSGGAMCAALAWAGLVMGSHDDAIDRLTRFWRDLEVHDLLDAAANFWSVFLARMPVTLEISPYAYEPVAAARMKELLFRHLAIEALPADPGRDPAALSGRSCARPAVLGWALHHQPSGPGVHGFAEAGAAG